METHVANKVQDKLFDKVSLFVNKKIEEHKWESLFIESGERLLCGRNSDDLIKDLQVAFSPENLKRMANDINSSSMYVFPVVLHDRLHDLMMRYEIPYEESEAYIHHFIQLVLNWLEEEKPDEFERVYLGECRREFSGYYEHILSAIKELGENIKTLKDKKIDALTIDDLERRIIKRARYPKLDLSFFETDDDLFDKDFCNALKNSDESIYIVGDSREEVLFRICNKIREEGYGLDTLIIEQEKEWLCLEKTGISGKVLVPNFISEEIPVVNNNINIFIYNREIPIYHENLELRKRTRNNLVSALNKIGVDNASIVFEHTHGLYSAISKKIFKDAIFSRPEWVRIPSCSVIAALLCGKWTECDGDKLVLEELSGLKYDEFLENILPYTRGENPLFIYAEGHMGRNWQLASVNDAWEELDEHIRTEQWKNFVNILYEILIVTDPLFENVPFSEHYIQRIFAKAQAWSQSLKEGMIRSLIMRAYYKAHIENQNEIDHLVTGILDTIDNKGKWGYISQYICLLCEASPEAVLSRIEKEFEKPTGLFEVFKENSGDMFTSSNYYINILWAVEKLLQLKDYTGRSIELLWNLNELDIEYKTGNNPADVLKKVFCAWYNCCPLSTDSKIRLAEKAVLDFGSAWDIVATELPGKTTQTIFPLASLHYRQEDEIVQPTWEDINRLHIAYLQICVDNSEKLSEEKGISQRWNILLEALSGYDDQIREKTLCILIEHSPALSDNHICDIKNKIRDIIHKHRYFYDADWSMPEKAIQDYENALYRLHPKEREYDYVYLCFHHYDFPILHPIPYDKEDNHAVHNQNDKMREDEISSGLKAFQARKLNVEKLIMIVLSAPNMTDNALGEVLAKYYSNYEYDDVIYQLLLKNDIKGYQVYKYVRELLFAGKMNIADIYNRSKELRINDDQLVYILSLQPICDEKSAFIYNEDDEIKKKFWKGEGLCPISKDITLKGIDKVLNECFQFGTIGSYIGILYEIRDRLNDEELLIRFIRIEDTGLIRRCVGGSFSYEFEELLIRLQKVYSDDLDKAQSLGRIELIFSGLIDWENMRCFQKAVRTDPALYAQMNEILFKKDNDSGDYIQPDEERKRFISHIYRLYQKALFCPAEKEGNVSYDELKQWIEKFKALLEKQNQKSQWERRIGRLLAYSPIGMDGFMPCEAVRRIIEENKSDEICDAYVTAERNKRGVYTVSAGREEMAISERYKKNAEALSAEYPWTAKVYSTLSNIYLQEAFIERERAAYE